MGIRIIRIKISPKEMKDWINNEGFVCLESEEYYPTTYAHLFFSKAYHHDETDDCDCTFDDWCKDHEIYTKWDLNYLYGSSNWDWEVIEDENGETQWLIIAIVE